MTELIVTTDLSTTGRAAAASAAAIHRATAAPVTLLHAVTPPPLGALSPFVPFGTHEDELAEELEAKAKSELEDQRSRLFGDGSQVNIDVRVGEPSDVIATVAKERPGATLVMGNHGFEALRRLFAGSVTDDVVARVDHDVIVVPPDGPVLGAARRVLLVAEPSDDMGHLASRAAAFAARGATLQLLRITPGLAAPIVSPLEPGHVDSTDDPTAEALSLLEDQLMAMRLRQPWSTVTGAVVADDHPGQLVAQRAADQAIDLVVMTAPASVRLEEVVSGTSPGGLMHVLERPCLFVASTHEAPATAAPEPAPLMTAWSTT